MEGALSELVIIYMVTLYILILLTILVAVHDTYLPELSSRHLIQQANLVL